MTEQKYLYILFSATPYRTGKLIRYVTGEPYNHVAITTEEDLDNIYSFSRRFYYLPLYGGFVTEHPFRYYHEGEPSKLALYRLPLTKEQWETYQQIITPMLAHQERYLYNHLSAMMAPLHRKVPVRDAFTCAEFAVSVLSRLGFPFDSGKFYTIADIARQLGVEPFYVGNFPAFTESDPRYFDRHPLPRPLWHTTRDFLRLFWRRARA